jgi:hypothetical protein
MSQYGKKILAAFALAFLCLPIAVDAGVSAIPGAGELSSVSMGTFDGANTGEKASSAAMRVLSTGKMILNGLAVIYLVYVGTMMIVAYGDDGALSKQKKQLMYALIAFLFVNIPGQIYNIFAGTKDQGGSIDPIATGGFSADSGSQNNIFLDYIQWNTTFENGVLGFMRIFVIGFALLYFTLAGFKLIVSGGDEDARKAAKNKALYGFLALIFLGVIEMWTSVAYSGNIGNGQNLFAKMANLALFFAGPTAIFFLTLGAWYYITSAGDEEKAKKGKAIVINTFIAVIILLASYTFLLDLKNF